jgi:hypothetical protein
VKTNILNKIWLHYLDYAPLGYIGGCYKSSQPMSVVEQALQLSGFPMR